MGTTTTTIELLLLIINLISVENGEKLTFRAAVVEFPFEENPSSSPKEIMLHNALRYEEYVMKAAQLKTDIIVFPEYGLTTWAVLNTTRETILPYLQSIPDKELWNPCIDDQIEDGNNQILVMLSCMAKNHSIILVANLCTLEKHPTNNNSYYHFNTNVIFAQNGTVIAKYHKYHLFAEEAFLDSPPTPEHPIIDIGFTQISTFICFDIDWYSPAAETVINNNVKTLIFTTSWFSELPFSFAPQVYSSWARGLGINFIAANYHYPQKAGFGSGIYSSQQGTLNQFNDLSATDYLIIANVPVDPSPVPTNSDIHATCSTSPLPKIISNYTTQPFVLTNKPSLKSTVKTHQIYYMNLNNFSIIHLHPLQTESSVNSGNVCCHVKYELQSANTAIDGYYSLLAYDGLRQFDKYKWPVQVCTVLHCNVENGSETCGQIAKIDSNLQKLILTASFTTRSVFPSVMDSDLQMVKSELWNYSVKYDDLLDKKFAVIEFESLRDILGVNMIASVAIH